MRDHGRGGRDETGFNALAVCRALRVICATRSGAGPGAPAWPSTPTGAQVSFPVPSPI